MINLYDENEFIKLKCKIKFLKFLYIFIIVFFVVSEFLLIFFANYSYKGIFMTCVAVVAVLSVFAFIYFFDRRKYLLIIYIEFATILDSKITEKKIKIIKSANKAITLSDSSCVYEIVYLEKDTEKTLYLSNIFENTFIEGKTYTIRESCGYIAGYQNED